MNLSVLTISTPIVLELILIPAGEFLMGSDPRADKMANANEQPQHPVYLPDYAIAKTPVTNAHYAIFVQATKYSQPKHWIEGKIPADKDDHPVVRVTWDDAVAFCEWLSQETEQVFGLPSEAEWEKAARGTDGRIYPRANEWDASRCNTAEGGPGATTAVNAYPQGASPYGLLDMAGNVFEWTNSWHQAYPGSKPKNEKDDEKSWVLRGGSWDNNLNRARCAFRYRFWLGSEDNDVGFRVVVSPES